MTRARRAAAALVVAALLLAAGFVQGYRTATRALPPVPVDAPSRPARPAEQRAKAEALLSLGYLAGYQPVREAKGIVRHERGDLRLGLAVATKPASRRPPLTKRCHWNIFHERLFID